MRVETIGDATPQTIFEAWRSAMLDRSDLPEMISFQQIWEAGFRHGLKSAEDICLAQACLGWPHAHAADCADQIRKAAINA